jgi:hypothetical protein
MDKSVYRKRKDHEGHAKPLKRWSCVRLISRAEYDLELLAPQFT